MRYAICYVSTASYFIEPSEVVEILDHTEVRNNEFGVKGLLVYSDGNFFEVLEGEEQMIRELFETIKNDPIHNNIIPIFEKYVVKELFKDASDENGFISQNTQFQKIRIENFKECIKDLDSGTRNVVNSILAQFGKNSPVGKDESPGTKSEDPGHSFLY
ncbi:BLUF domain-containing protein [Antarcticibacterium arcticum]|uniref:BLUF domain-containing protein n=1 Tax=Antarcticibacterium arcticum TaxID=2585771 RepID=A0A5B8YFA7_9FLAO|nr:BLUF domain-containing protein [Antarcticibacterium arcticum]QED36595.1 BLUF domain-containing protein [Antarcticibacterium arcticum]